MLPSFAEAWVMYAIFGVALITIIAEDVLNHLGLSHHAKYLKIVANLICFSIVLSQIRGLWNMLMDLFIY